MPLPSISSITERATYFLWLPRALRFNNIIWSPSRVRFWPPVSHRLLVEYGVDNLNGSAPLVLDYFIIRNLTSPPFTTNPPNTTSLSNTTRLSKGAITGVVIGSLIGLALIMFSLIRFIKVKKVAAFLGRRPNQYAAGAYGDGRGDS